MGDRKKQLIYYIISLICLIFLFSLNASADSPKLTKKITISVGETKKVKLKNNDKKVKWSSSNKHIKIVKGTNTHSKIKGISIGKSVLTAKIGKKKYKCNVIIIKEDNRKISEIEKYLKDNNCLTGDKFEKEASIIGAKKGFGYSNGVEVYEYDINNSNYKKLKKGKKIEIWDGFSIKASAINGKFVLVFSYGTKEDKNIINTFKAFK